MTRDDDFPLVGTLAARATPPPRERRSNVEPEEIDQREAIGLVQEYADPSRHAPAPAREVEAEPDLFAVLEPSPPFWAPWLSAPVMTWLVVLLAAGLLLFIAAQAATLIASLQVLPQPFQSIALGGATLLVLAALTAGVRLLLLYRRLVISPRVQLDPVLELARRQQARTAVVHGLYSEARRRIEPLLTDYPLERLRPRLLACGLKTNDVDAIGAERSRLAHFNGTPKMWLCDYEAGVLHRIDRAAGIRIGQACRRAGLLTAVSPRGGIDAVLVSALTLDLVADLCTLYNLRASRVDTVRILSAILLNTVVASQAEDLSGWAAANAVDQFSENVLDLGAVVAKSAATVLGGVMDGALNARLVARVGSLTCLALRPLAYRRSGGNP